MKVVRATGDIPHQLQGQKVKGQGHQAAVVAVRHYLQGTGAYCGGSTTDRTACCYY